MFNGIYGIVITLVIANCQQVAIHTFAKLTCCNKPTSNVRESWSLSCMMSSLTWCQVMSLPYGVN